MKELPVTCVCECDIHSVTHDKHVVTVHNASLSVVGHSLASARICTLWCVTTCVGCAYLQLPILRASPCAYVHVLCCTCLFYMLTTM